MVSQLAHDAPSTLSVRHTTKARKPRTLRPALPLWDPRIEPIPGAPRAYRVQSESDPHERYTANLTTLTCTCFDSTAYRQDLALDDPCRPCKHLVSAAQYEQEPAADQKRDDTLIAAALPAPTESAIDPVLVAAATDDEAPPRCAYENRLEYIPRCTRPASSFYADPYCAIHALWVGARRKVVAL